MKKGILKRGMAIALCLAVVFSSASCDGGEKGSVGKMTVKTALTTQKITRDADIFKLTEGAVEISGAKGETDSGQFIVRCDENVKSYDVKISDFVSGEERIASENVEICKQVYTYCSSGRYTGTLAAGYYPDAIIPIEYIKTAGEDVIEKGKNQGFWLNVDIPVDAVAGVYAATVTMTYNQTGEITVPVSLKVYDFTIDELPSFNSVLSIYQDWLHYGELTDSDEKYNDYQDVLLKYNSQTGKVPDSTPEIYIGYLREYYDKMTVVRIPYKSISTTQNDWEYLEGILDAMMIASIEDGKNYFEKAFYRLDMFYDEYNDVAWRKELVRPTIQGCNDLEEKLVAKYVAEGKIEADGEIATSLLGLRHAVTNTEGWDEEFADVFDMYVVGFQGLHYTAAMEEFARLQEEEDLVLWGYGCIKMDAYPNPGMEINDYLTSIREAMWFDYEYDIEAFYTWNVNGYCNWSYYTPFGWQIIDDLYTTASHEGLSAGDGYLLYPGAPYGSKYPFASIRLATIRDGVDDHTYMSQLARLYQNMSGYGENYAVSDAKGLVRFLNDRLLGLGASKLDVQGVGECKEVLAQAIMLAEKNGFVVDKLETVNDRIEYSFYADADVSVSLNGQKLVGTTSGQGLRFTGAIQIPANRNLVVEVKSERLTGELKLLTVPSETVISEIETQNDISKLFLVAKTDKVELNEDKSYSISGNSAKITLNGRTGSDTIIKSYTPTFLVPMSNFGVGLEEIYSIEFEIFNASNKDTEFIVYFESTDENGIISSVDYDKIVLKAGEWRKVVLDNFNVIGIDKAALAKYDSVGLKCSNLLDNNQQPYAITLYVDHLSIRKK